MSVHTQTILKQADFVMPQLLLKELWSKREIQIHRATVLRIG